MNITFLLGNGFDMNFGLETSYKSFYNYLKKSKIRNKLIENILSDTECELWSDLELGLGNYLSNINTESEIEDFWDEKETVENLLVDYLTLENDKFEITDEKAIANTFNQNVVNFHKEFNRKEHDHYDEMITEFEFLKYQFITYNYTDIIDTIISSVLNQINPFSKHKYKSALVREDTLCNALHIHGTLDEGIVLALNDTSQINNDKLQDNDDLKRFMIKSQINEEDGNLLTDDALRIIENSLYICIFGMSIGDTDNMWWQAIINWLIQDEDRRIVFFVKDNTKIAKSKAAKMKFNRDKRKVLSQHSVELSNEDYEKIESQVIVILNSDIFDLEGYQIKKPIKENSGVPTKLFDSSLLQGINTTALSAASKEIQESIISNAIKGIVDSKMPK